MTDLTQEQFENMIDMFQESFYGSPGFNNEAQDQFIDDLVGYDKLKLLDPLTKDDLTDQQKIDFFNSLQAEYLKRCQQAAKWNCWRQR